MPPSALPRTVSLPVQGFAISLLLVLCRTSEARFLRLPSSSTSLFASFFSGGSDSSSLASAEGTEHPIVTETPLIGILSQPGDGEDHEVHKAGVEKFNEEGRVSYIAASYVKFVEMGGGRVVPIIYNEPEEEIERKFRAINGLIFPGGGAKVDAPNNFTLTAKKLFKMALDANDNGDYFPVHGTCLGFELLNIFVSKDYDILESFTAEGKPAPLDFVSHVAKNRAWFRWMGDDLVEKLERRNLAMENHERGLSPEKMESNSLLSNFFRILTTTPDQYGKVYVSSVEGREYPVYGTQWHPEKNAFEFGMPRIPHSADAVKVAQAVANFFINEARKSRHRSVSREQLMDDLIYNYSPVFSGRQGNGTDVVFDQSYVFNADVPRLSPHWHGHNN
eukprot:TRINITY_DN12973_c0_g1_i1.p1 TRINITY_DN12973_c0_g1~~TRINITY_DN12973_c0_g1_i1.p1  ORF type:complete len:391 (-),score=83.06 TRINITY_DN12973_c0_g1_i1:702-1874(-)